MFEETEYINEQNGQAYPMFLMNRDGFSLLAMGFNGKQALKFKMDFVCAFNKMEETLKRTTMTALPDFTNPAEAARGCGDGQCYTDGQIVWEITSRLAENLTDEFLAVLSEGRNLPSSDLVKVTYGDNGATWMHEDVAIEFARWLSPAFAIWCNDRIKELLTIGMTATQPTLEAMLDNHDLVIGLATQLKMQREENARLESENRQQMAVIEQQTPKVEYFQKFMTSQHGSTATCIRELVKQTHMKSEKRFIKWMLDKSIGK